MKKGKKKDRSKISPIIVRLSDEDRADFNILMEAEDERMPGIFAEKIIRRWMRDKKKVVPSNDEIATQLASIRRAIEEMAKLPRGSLSSGVSGDPIK